LSNLDLAQNVYSVYLTVVNTQTQRELVFAWLSIEALWLLYHPLARIVKDNAFDQRISLYGARGGAVG
jgi:hypothetical protein